MVGVSTSQGGGLEIKEAFAEHSELLMFSLNLTSEHDPLEVLHFAWPRHRDPSCAGNARRIRAGTSPASRARVGPIIAPANIRVTSSKSA